MKTLFVLLIATVSISAANDLYFPPVSGDTWETLAPESLGWHSDSLASLQDYLETKNTKSFIILKDGRIVVEWYFDDFNREKYWYWASAGKSLVAFLIGLAQQQGLLNINDKSSNYLGEGWTSAPPEKEALITIRHQLTMTTGLDDGYDFACTADSCLHYLADAGDRWAYHNGPYTLLLDVIEKASGMTKNRFTRTQLLDRIGMKGLWLKIGYLQLFSSNTRSMARYGLLIQNRGMWQSDTLLYDHDYFNAMTHRSQELNKSYGYLWWLNGQGSYMLPLSQTVYNTDLIPNAPDGLIAALGKNDQKLYISDSLGLVVVRLGDEANQPDYALSSFDNDLWGKIMNLSEAETVVQQHTEDKVVTSDFALSANYPNPFNDHTVLTFTLPTSEYVSLQAWDARGRRVAILAQGEYASGRTNVHFDAAYLPSGIYFFKLITRQKVFTRKALLLR